MPKIPPRVPDRPDPAPNKPPLPPPREVVEGHVPPRTTSAEDHLRRIISFFDDFGNDHPATSHVLAYGLGPKLEAAREAIGMKTRPYGKLWPPKPKKPVSDDCY